MTGIGRYGGMPEDHVQEYKWFNLAASRSPDEIRELVTGSVESPAATLTYYRQNL